MSPIRRSALSIVLATGMLIATSAPCALAQSQPADAAPSLRLARGEDGKVTLGFTPVTGAKTYAIRVVGGDGKEEVIENVEVVNYTVHGLANGRDYRFAVCAADEGSKGPWSNELSATPVDQPGWDTLREAFTSGNPTKNSNPFTMIHGKESEAELRAILRAVYDAGFEGATLHPYDYEDFLGPGQWERWKILFDQARRLGLTIWQQDDRTYPSGFAGGKVVAAHPEFGRTMLAEAARQVIDGPKKGCSIDIQPLLKGRDFLVSVTAYPADGEPLDLTDRVAEGKCVWDAPAGRWNLFAVKAVWCEEGPYIDRLVYVEPQTKVPTAAFPYVDFLNPRAVDALIETLYQPAYDRFPREFGRTFKGYFTDEAPVEFRQFTPDLLERFEKAKGYCVRKYLPSLWHDLGKLDRKVRVDYRDFVREQNATVFFGRTRQWCRDHGVQLIGHVMEDHQQDMRRLECLDIPGFDEIMGHWYDPNPDVYWRESKVASSVAHYAGSHNDVALIEHFAATGWRTGLSEMKRMMDWSTAMGINQTVPCGLDTQMPPSWEIAPDFWVQGKNPQWPYFAAYQAAANRMTMLMRGGRHVAPAIILDTTESEWVRRGADLNWDHPAQDGLWQYCAAMSQAHVDFDLIPYDVFADTARASFDKDRVRIGKEAYRAVVVPNVEHIPAAVAERLRAFYDAGGTVVAIDRLPSASCSGQEDDRVRAAVDGVWGARASHRGKAAVVSREQVGACLAGLNVPDVLIPPQGKSLLYCHRQLHGKDLYFFANTGADPVDATVELRGVRGVPTLWDPINGTIVGASYDLSDNDVLKLRLNLGEYESLFVVVDPDGSPSEAKADRASLANSRVLPGPWQVVDGVDAYHRCFSTEAQLPADWPIDACVRLELHGASEVIRASVNGKPVGVRFCAPYRFEVGKALRAGGNRIEIERVGRIAFPNAAIPPPETNDATVTVPCREATLTAYAK